MFLFFTILPILAIVCYFYNKQTYAYWEKRKLITIPGAQFPFGNIKGAFSKDSQSVPMQFSEFYKYLREKGVKHGGAYIFQKPVYIPCDPAVLKMILTKDYNYFEEKGLYYNEKDQPMSLHLFNIGGSRWKNLRYKLTPTFTSVKTKSMFPSIIQCSQPMIEAISKSIDQGESIDIKHTCASFTIDVIGTCVFGIDCNTFKNPNSDFIHFGHKIHNGSMRFQLQASVAFAFPKFAQLLRFIVFDTDIEHFYERITKDTINYREENDIYRNDFIQMLVELQRNGEITMQEVISQAFIFFIGGYETSAMTMSYLMMELSGNTDIQEKCREEIFKVLKQHNNELTYESVMDMKYLEQCIWETLRKYPALPILNRECTKTYKVPGTDVVLEKGTKVFVPLMGIHYDPEYYPDPEKFDPERFSDENKQTLNPYNWMPFGEGPRICIGIRFGVLQVKISIIQLLSHFRFTLAKKIEFPVKFQNAFTVRMVEDIIVKGQML